MRETLFWITIIVGAWLLFIKPIIAVCAAYDAGTLTGSMIGWTIIKCLVFAPIAEKVIMNVTLTIAEAILD